MRFEFQSERFSRVHRTSFPFRLEWLCLKALMFKFDFFISNFGLNFTHSTWFFGSKNDQFNVGNIHIFFDYWTLAFTIWVHEDRKALWSGTNSQAKYPGYRNQIHVFFSGDLISQIDINLLIRLKKIPIISVRKAINQNKIKSKESSSTHRL